MAMKVIEELRPVDVRAELQRRGVSFPAVEHFGSQWVVGRRVPLSFVDERDRGPFRWCLVERSPSPAFEAFGQGETLKGAFERALEWLSRRGTR